MATKNKFPVLLQIIENIQNYKRVNRLIREQVKEPGNDFNKRMSDWLREKKYALRDGQIQRPPTDNRIDPIYEKTPTERLHPGAKSLAESMVFRIRKITGEESLGLRWESTAPHAPYFFGEKHKSFYPIAAKNAEALVFWTGFPKLPWHPPVARKTPGPLKFPKPNEVTHPGATDYTQDIYNLFEQFADEGIGSAIGRALDNVFDFDNPYDE